MKVDIKLTRTDDHTLHLISEAESVEDIQRIVGNMYNALSSVDEASTKLKVSVYDDLPSDTEPDNSLYELNEDNTPKWL